MNKRVLFILILFFITIAISFLFIYSQKTHNIPLEDITVNIIPSEKEVIDSNMQLASSSFTNNQMIQSKYTCDGENTSPPLTINGIPEKTRSLVLIVDDPDTPVGDWVHWLVWNINPNTGKIAEGEIPSKAIQGVNDFGENKYGGPCPPSGTHRYQFKLYALDTTLDLPNDTKKIDLETALTGHILDQTMLVGTYQKR